MRSIFFVYRYGDHRVLPLLTHSFPTRRASDLPDGGPETAPQACACRHPYLVLLPVGFAVPLPLPVARCALTAPFHPYHEAANPKTGVSWRSALCGTVPGVAPAGRYPAPCFRGART